jgi:transcriptional regulator with XRE-family HTH domain
MDFRSVDNYIGSRVRGRRMALGISQTNLANALGVCFQQVQKYEKGSNRISASKILAISQVLKCPVSYFFDGADEIGGREKGLAPNDQQVSMESHEVYEMISNYSRISDTAVRKGLRKLISSLAGGKQPG